MLYKAKIGKGGKVSIPVIFRKFLHAKEGEEILFEMRDEQVIISSMKHSLEKARNLINKYHPSNESLLDKFIAEKRIEAENE